MLVNTLGTLVTCEGAQSCRSLCGLFHCFLFSLLTMPAFVQFSSQFWPFIEPSERTSPGGTAARGTALLCDRL